MPNALLATVGRPIRISILVIHPLLRGDRSLLTPSDSSLGLDDG